MVITPDFESGILGSNPSRTKKASNKIDFLFFKNDKGINQDRSRRQIITMVNKNNYLTKTREELKEIKKPKLIKSKYMFTESFAKIVHEFSRAHSKETLKEFRTSYNNWIKEPHIQDAIQEEIANIRQVNGDETQIEIMKKIQISARFYYRKKSNC